MSTRAEVEQRDWTRIALNLIVVGLMTVSIHGQVATISPRLGDFFAVVFAVGQDAAALLALNTGFRAPAKSSIRKWAWAAVLIASFTGGALNAYYVSVVPLRDVAGIDLKDADGNSVMPPLPQGFGLLIGLEPILLILVLSHLVGLAAEMRRQRRQPASAGDRQPAPLATASTASAGDRQRPPARQPAAAGDRQPAAAGDRQATRAPAASSGAGDRQPAPLAINPPATATPDAPRRAPRPAAPSARSSSPADPQSAARATITEPAPRALHAVPVSAERPDWMTDALIDAVLDSVRKAHAEDKSYGRPAAMADHGLTGHRARRVLEYIDTHDLLRRPA